MQLLAPLNHRWHDRLRFRPVSASPYFTEDGLCLGTGTVLVKGVQGRLSLAGSERRVVQLLRMAHEGAVDGGCLPALHRAIGAWNDGDETRALIHIALARLPPLPDRAADHRLFLSAGLLDGGQSPEILEKIAGFTADGAIVWGKAYHPDQPRKPAGPGGGQWVREAGAASDAMPGLESVEDNFFPGNIDGHIMRDAEGKPHGTLQNVDGHVRLDTGEKLYNILRDIHGHVLRDANGNPYLTPMGFDIQRNIEIGRNLGMISVCLEDGSQCFRTEAGFLAAYPAMVLNFFTGGKMDYQRNEGLVPVISMWLSNIIIDHMTSLDNKYRINFDGNLKAITSFNFGVVGAAADFSLEELLVSAGKFNRYFGNTKRELDRFGNFPENSENIVNGYRAYQNKIFGENNDR